MKRRAFLLGTTALATVAAGQAMARFPLSGGAAVSSGGAPATSVVISGTGLVGDPFTYNVSAGTDIGSYIDPYGRFTMANIKCTVAGCPLVVYFRHDLPFSPTGRHEIVVEYPPGYSTASSGSYQLGVSPTYYYIVGGSGYQPNDIVTIVGGTYTTPASFDAYNGIDVYLNNPGLYSVLPASPANISGGSGTGGKMYFSVTCLDMIQYQAQVYEGSTPLFTGLNPGISFLNCGPSQSIPATIVAPGTGYSPGDRVYPVGGTYTVQAWLEVASVGAGGAVTGFYAFEIPPNSPTGGGQCGTYTQVPVGTVATTTGGTGTGLTITPRWLGHQAGQRWRWQESTRGLIPAPDYISAMTLASGGTLNQVGDVLTLQGGTSVGGIFAAQITVTGVSGGTITTFDFYPGEYLTPPPSVATANNLHSGTSATFNITSAAYGSVIDYLAQTGKTFIYNGISTPGTVPSSVTDFSYTTLSPSALTLPEGEPGGYVEDYEAQCNVCSSYYLNTGDARGLGTYSSSSNSWTGGLFGLAEAGGTVNICYPDPTVGYGAWDWDNAALESISVYLSSMQLFTIEANHIAEFSHIAFLLTSDPYYIELHQYTTSFMCGVNQLALGGTGISPVLGDSPRTAANVLRYMMQAYSSSFIVSGNNPSWLLPWNYWARKLENARQYTLGYYSESLLSTQAAIRSRISQYPADVDWMFPLYQGSLEAGTMLNIPGWAAIADFCGKYFVDSTSGTSGWSRGNIIPYDNNSYVSGNVDLETGLYVNSITDFNILNNVLAGVSATPQGYGGAPDGTSILDQGADYAIRDILQLTGGSATVPAAVQVTSLGLTTSGPMASPGNGAYVVGDTLTVSGGTLTTLPSGGTLPAQFKVVSKVGSTITLGMNTSAPNGGQGCYSVLPPNPCSLSGGTGTGGTADFGTVIAYLASQKFSGISLTLGWNDGGGPFYPKIATISSGTYNSTTGVVSLTTTTAHSLSPGSPFILPSGLTGTGNYLAMIDVPYTAASGTTGSTLNFVVATGWLTMTITGGTVNGGLPLTGVAGGTITTISSGTYNSTTGAVSLTTAAAHGLTVGNNVFVNGVTGTGSFAALNYLQVYAGEYDYPTAPWIATSGTSGTTLNFTIPTGLTMTITGGNVIACSPVNGNGATVFVEWVGNFGTSLAVRSLTIIGGGTDYSALDILQLANGDTYAVTYVQVTSVNPSTGAITGLAWDNYGTKYIQLPANPVTLSGGAGTGATLTAGWAMGDPAEQNLPTNYSLDYIPYCWGCLASLTARGVTGASAGYTWLSGQLSYPPNTDDYGWNIDSGAVPSAPYPFPVVNADSYLPDLFVTTSASTYDLTPNSFGGIPCTVEGNGTNTLAPFEASNAYTLTFAPDGSGSWADSHASFGQISFKGFTTVGVVQVALPTTYPVGISLSSTTISHSASTGTVLGAITVTMSDASSFSGTLSMLVCPTVGTGNSYFDVVGSNVEVSSTLPSSGVVGMIIEAEQGTDCMGNPYKLHQFFPVTLT